ncbi:hypothetical protein [uncultured Lentibacter sp.]|uniref:hypothetical protein n=1 Tax=uncultured Lentibacter sp. TaxID=1659309 RepID=UPI002621BCE9|nr:hypothetical protein [uncultured Lentibacter sp.]
MYGVVLWSDQKDQKAVIWCEDHGDLAFYGGGGTSLFDGRSLDAGDLVQFSVQDGVPMRRAENPELVAVQHSPALARRLIDAVGTGRNLQKVAGQTGGSEESTIVPFVQHCPA